MLSRCGAENRFEVTKQQQQQQRRQTRSAFHARRRKRIYIRARTQPLKLFDWRNYTQRQQPAHPPIYMGAYTRGSIASRETGNIYIHIVDSEIPKRSGANWFIAQRRAGARREPAFSPAIGVYCSRKWNSSGSARHFFLLFSLSLALFQGPTQKPLAGRV